MLSKMFAMAACRTLCMSCEDPEVLVDCLQTIQSSETYRRLTTVSEQLPSARHQEAAYPGARAPLQAFLCAG